MTGKEFDALVIDLNAQKKVLRKEFLDNFRDYALEEKFQRFIYIGTFHNMISIYVHI